MQIIIDLIQQGKNAAEIAQELKLPLDIAEKLYEQLKHTANNG
jgi:hypothetical protein